jgi:hypothetical protein
MMTSLVFDSSELVTMLLKSRYDGKGNLASITVYLRCPETTDVHQIGNATLNQL